MILIRRIKPGEGILFREVRLSALKESPEAFATTYETALSRSFRSWEEQADGTAEGSDYATFFVFNGDLPVGLAALYRNPGERTQGEIIQLWVSPDLRGTGVAVELAKFLLKWARANAFDLVIAKVYDTNQRSRSFFRKLGFCPAGDFFSRGEGEEMLVKCLSAGQDKSYESN